MDIKLKAALATALLSISALSHASVIIGDSNLLDDIGVAQLSTWLGRSDITLTNIFTKGSDNSSAAAFHAAADGRGATIVLYHGTENGVTTTFGGYNPLSWKSNNTWNTYFSGLNPAAFIFNLTTSTLRRELSDNYLQTYNGVDYGPTFGSGNDIYVNSTLTGGYSFGESFETDFLGQSILSGAAYDGNGFAIDQLEVFTVASSVPEPSSVALLGLGVLGLATARRKSTRSERSSESCFRNTPI